MLPFSSDQFISVFQMYNLSVWPMQILFYILAIYIIYLIFKNSKNSSKIISLILFFFWLWIGVVYHLIYFIKINPAAKIFGIVFIIQALLFFIFGVIKNKIKYTFSKNIYSYLGIIFIFTALLFYPLVGLLLGHTYPNSPTFGLPCPTTIFTFGVLLLAQKLPKSIVIIPFMWSIVGFSASFAIGMKEDIILLITGIISALFIFFRKFDGEEK